MIKLYMLEKQHRLRKRTEFAYSFAKGKKQGNKLLTLVIFKRKDKLLRIGFSVSKKCGKAVVRNKIRRQLRAIVRELIQNKQIELGHNLVFIAKDVIINATFGEMKEAIEQILKSNGLITGEKE